MITDSAPLDSVNRLCFVYCYINALIINAPFKLLLTLAVFQKPTPHDYFPTLSEIILLLTVVIPEL